MKSLKLAVTYSIILIIAPALIIESFLSVDYTQNGVIFQIQKFLYSLFVLILIALVPAGFKVFNKRAVLIYLSLFLLILAWIATSVYPAFNGVYTVAWFCGILLSYLNDRKIANTNVGSTNFH